MHALWRATEFQGAGVAPPRVAAKVDWAAYVFHLPSPSEANIAIWYLSDDNDSNAISTPISSLIHPL